MLLRLGFAIYLLKYFRGFIKAHELAWHKIAWVDQQDKIEIRLKKSPEVEFKKILLWKYCIISDKALARISINYKNILQIPRFLPPTPFIPTTYPYLSCQAIATHKMQCGINKKIYEIDYLHKRPHTDFKKIFFLQFIIFKNKITELSAIWTKVCFITHPPSLLTFFISIIHNQNDMFSQYSIRLLKLLVTSNVVEQLFQWFWQWWISDNPGKF